MRARIAKYSPYIILGLSILLLVCLNILCHDHWLDSDMAAEMIFSRQLAESGHFFATADWYYSTEFRFLYTHWIMGPLFRICANWHVIRAVTNLLSYALVLGAYYYCMKPLKVRRGLVIMSSALLLLPFSETMMTHMAMGNTYLFHVAIAYCFFGLYLRLTGVVKGNRIVRIIFYMALALVCGVSGVRYLLALQCPLVLAGLFYLLRSAEFDLFRQNLTAENGAARMRELARCPAMKYFGYALLGLAGSAAGYAVNVLYVSREYVFQTYDSTNFIAVYQGVFFERLQNALGSLLMLFGYIPERSVLSLRGMVTLAAFGILGILAYCAVRAGRESRGQRLFVSLFLASALCLNLFVFVFTTSTMVPRYYITIFIFVLPMLCFYYEKEERYWDRLAVSVLLGACMLLAVGKTVLSYVSTDKNEDRRRVAAFLEEGGYSFGYASYWNANIITELTDGAVEIANVGDAENLEYFKWSSPMKYYEEGYPKGEVFLLLTAEEIADAADAESVAAGRVVYEDDAYTVLVYGSARTLMETAAGADK
ncbi:MAG: hypothetical protein NC079_11195 [Clostridium sp.]|nr:hypothetical protein [Acetatifactor muris]MCM1526108.1 hypothetical protein [Bacteroides sp.]MCM1564155.1 hypothetical protein [Clostridium sp.]